MAKLLSQREIDALLEVEGESPSLAKFALAYKDEIALHRRVYELCGTNSVSIISSGAASGFKGMFIKLFLD